MNQIACGSLREKVFVFLNENDSRKLNLKFKKCLL